MKRIGLLYFGIMLGLFIMLSPTLVKASEINQVVNYEIEDNTMLSPIVKKPLIDYKIGDKPIVDLSEDDTMYEIESDLNDDEIRPKYNIHYTYKITKKEIWGRGWYAYRQGPSGRGPATLNINQSKSLNRSFTNTISGEYPIGKGKIASSLGVSIGTTKTYGTGYSIPVEAGRTKQIIYRPEVLEYRITQRMYANGYPTNTYKYAKVIVFQDWDYDWKYLR